MQKLNAKEKAVLDCIRRSIAQNGYAPSVRDIGAALGYHSTSTVQMYLDRLETYGYLRRNGGKSRSISLCREKKELCAIPLLRADAPLDVPLTEDCFEGELDFCYCGALPEDAELFAVKLSGDHVGEVAVVVRGTEITEYRVSAYRNDDGLFFLSDDVLSTDKSLLGMVISLFKSL